MAFEYPMVHVCVSSALGNGGTIERVDRLTPYLIQTIVEDALACGQDATVQLRPLDGVMPELPPSLRRLQHRIQVLPRGEGRLEVVRPDAGPPPHSLGDRTRRQ